MYRRDESNKCGKNLNHADAISILSFVVGEQTLYVFMLLESVYIADIDCENACVYIL